MAGTSTITAPDWIAVDWGTSALRVWALGRDGDVLEKAVSQEGMGGLAPADYEPVLINHIRSWLPETAARSVPVIVCGMAGAKQGWKDAGYRQAPCAVSSGSEMPRVSTRDARLSVSILPGICQMEPADVMRGEETQLAGLVARLGPVDTIVCLPGTHSKWVRLEGGRIAGFRTFMTGELFSVIVSHSILRHSIAPEGENTAAFAKAVKAMLDDPAGLTGALFAIRASGLVGQADGAAARSRLSGLLIGAELAATRPQWAGRSVYLVGSGTLNDAYVAALEAAGAHPVREDAEALTLAGLKQARAAMLEAQS
ncbi:2-dehydro-3-deoxygalactonokinase [uncultured Roseibium sp.]|uniref:2-dehydro-3-deoxygalactonokinase n=1 Tax=uncultured Roseibium sp. TaxID=1936171 RepID=UPI003216857B